MAESSEDAARRLAEEAKMTQQECAGCHQNVWWDAERPVLCADCDRDPAALVGVIFNLQAQLSAALQERDEARAACLDAANKLEQEIEARMVLRGDVEWLQREIERLRAKVADK